MTFIQPPEFSIAHELTFNDSSFSILLPVSSKLILLAPFSLEGTVNAVNIGAVLQEALVTGRKMVPVCHRDKKPLSRNMS